MVFGTSPKLQYQRYPKGQTDIFRIKVSIMNDYLLLQSKHSSIGRLQRHIFPTAHVTDKQQSTNQSFYTLRKNLKIPKGGNQNLYIEDEQTTQWPKDKVQKDKQRSTKHTYKTKDRVTRTPIKNGCELKCSGKVSSSQFGHTVPDDKMLIRLLDNQPIYQ